MKFVTYLLGNEARLGLLDGDAVIDMNQADASVPSSLRAALREGVDLQAAAKKALASGAAHGQSQKIIIL